MISSFNNQRYKYTEYRIEPNNEIFVLGFFKTLDRHNSPFRDNKSIELSKANKNIKKLRRQANSKKSELSEMIHENVDLVVDDIRNSISSINTDWDNYINSLPNIQRVNYLSHRNDPCIISTYSQKKLISKYKLGSFISAAGSGIAVILLVLFLYIRIYI